MWNEITLEGRARNAGVEGFEVGGFGGDGGIGDTVGEVLELLIAGNEVGLAAKAYEDGGRKLAPTGPSILTTCAKLQKLGAKQSDKNPLPQIVDIDDVPQLEVDS